MSLNFFKQIKKPLLITVTALLATLPITTAEVALANQARTFSYLEQNYYELYPQQQLQQLLAPQALQQQLGLLPTIGTANQDLFQQLPFHTSSAGLSDLQATLAQLQQQLQAAQGNLSTAQAALSAAQSSKTATAQQKASAQTAVTQAQ